MAVRRPSGRSWRVRTGLLVAAALSGAATVLAPTDGAAAAPERCDGVWVVVDAAGLGGPTTVRCAETDRAIDGTQVLERAGHSYSYVPGQEGFICRIDRRPDPCPGTPPLDAHWSYWLAEPGGEWRKSNRGATFRTAEPGTVDAWAFGAGDPPSVPPPSPAPARDDEPERDRTSEPTADAPSQESEQGREQGRDRGASSDRSTDSAGSDGGPDASPSDGEDVDGGTAAEDAGDRPDSGGDAAASGRDDTSEPAEDDDPVDVAEPLVPDPLDDELGGETPDEDVDRSEDRVADDEVLLATGADDGGSLTTLLLGGGLVGGLAAAAVVTTRRRRTAGGGTP